MTEDATQNAIATREADAGPIAQPAGRARRARARRRRRWAIWMIVAVAGALILVLVDGYLQAYRAAVKLERAYPALERLKTIMVDSPKGRDATVEEAVAQVRDAEQAVRGARFTFSFTGSLPYVGRPVDAVRLAADAASHGATAIEAANRMLGEAGDLVKNGAVDLELLAGFQDRLGGVQADLRSARNDLRAIPHLPFIDRLDVLRTKAIQQTSSQMESLTRLRRGVGVLLPLLGRDRPQTYFMALQNNADQRATGGAVLAFAVMRIDAGKIQVIRSGGILSIDQHRRRLWGFDTPPVQWFRSITGRPPLVNNGSNYTPNFPQVARTWASQVGNVIGQRIDQVIALDPFAVSLALRGQGSLRIPSYPSPITADNVVAVTENAQYGLPQEAQLALPAQLVVAAFNVMTNPRDPVAMIRNLSSALAQKRVQLWSADGEAQRLFHGLHWDGAISKSAGDYLYLVTNKRNKGKVDYFTEHSIDYHVSLQPNGDARSKVDIRLDNRVPPGQPEYVVGPWPQYGLNVAMLSLYVPKAARDVRVTPAAPIDFPTPPVKFVSHREAEKRLLIKAVEAYPGHPGLLRYTYDLPHVAERRADGTLVYTLTVQHQPLARAANLHVSLQPPDGFVVASAGPGWKVDDSQATFSGPVFRDFTTSVTVRPANS